MNIIVDLDTPISDGTEVVFRSPVDCSQVAGLLVNYQDNGDTASKEFAFADAHGNNVGDIDHLFAENVAVKVILDVTTGMAFVQNADTNAYLEGRFAKLESMIGPSGQNMLIVTRDTASEYTLASHTPEQILEAANQSTVVVFNDGSGDNAVFYHLEYVDSNRAQFFRIMDDAGMDAIIISADRSIEHIEHMFATVDYVNSDEYKAEITQSIPAVLYTEQDLTPEQQAQARANIGVTSTGGGGSGVTFISSGALENLVLSETLVAGTRYMITDNGYDFATVGKFAGAIFEAANTYELKIVFDPGTPFIPINAPSLSRLVGDGGLSTGCYYFLTTDGADYENIGATAGTVFRAESPSDIIVSVAPTDLGDIEAALDSIIAIQNSLIGGDGV